MILSYFFRNYVITFDRKRPQDRHTAQIKALDLFYQNQVSKSWEKLGIVQKIDLKVRHHPQNTNFFFEFFF